jgi:hypothetical protein
VSAGAKINVIGVALGTTQIEKKKKLQKVR